MTAALADGMHMWMTFAVIVGAIVLFAVERVPIELSAIGTVAALLILFYVFPLRDAEGENVLDTEALLAGFAHPALFAILALLVVGQGLFHTGAVEKSTEALGTLLRIAPKYALAVTLVLAGSVSAFLNNTPVVIIFVPILSVLATRRGLNAGNVLMPLSFLTILGGMTTLIGSSANLVAVAASEASGGPIINFFDFAIPGLFLAAIGAVYVLLVMPYILKSRAPKPRRDADYGKQFIAQITVTADNPWLGTRSVGGMFPDLKQMTVRLVRRGYESFLPPFEDLVLQEGDVVVIAATRQVLLDTLKQHSPLIGVGDEDKAPRDGRNEKALREPQIMTEAVVAPGSRLIGRNVVQARLTANTGCTVLGIERRSRMVRAPMEEIFLKAGDVLLLLGTTDAIRGLRNNRDLLLLARSRAELPLAHHAKRAFAIFLAMVGVAASGLVPIAIAAISAAIAMILGGCLTVQQAARAFDRKIYLLVGTALALATALQESGGAHSLAHAVVEAVSDYGPAMLLSALFLLTAILTNFLSNHATAALVAPIAVSAAAEVGADPAPFIYGLIFALNCSFATPIAYQTNLIVMGPGHYTFADFMKAGTPLILLLWVAYSLFAPLYFRL